MSMRCAKCKAVFADELLANWGTDSDGDGVVVGQGLGPDPRCIALIELRGVPRDPRAPDQIPVGVCGGPLVAVTAAATHDFHTGAEL